MQIKQKSEMNENWCKLQKITKETVRTYPTQTLAQVLFVLIHLQHCLQWSFPQTQARETGTLEDFPPYTSTMRAQGTGFLCYVSWKQGVQGVTAPQ